MGYEAFAFGLVSDVMDFPAASQASADGASRVAGVNGDTPGGCRWVQRLAAVLLPVLSTCICVGCDSGAVQHLEIRTDGAGNFRLSARQFGSHGATVCDGFWLASDRGGMWSSDSVSLSRGSYCGQVPYYQYGVTRDGHQIIATSFHEDGFPGNGTAVWSDTTGVWRSVDVDVPLRPEPGLNVTEHDFEALWVGADDVVRVLTTGLLLEIEGGHVVRTMPAGVPIATDGGYFSPAGDREIDFVDVSHAAGQVYRMTCDGHTCSWRAMEGWTLGVDSRPPPSLAEWRFFHTADGNPVGVFTDDQHRCSVRWPGGSTDIGDVPVAAAPRSSGGLIVVTNGPGTTDLPGPTGAAQLHVLDANHGHRTIALGGHYASQLTAGVIVTGAGAMEEVHVMTAEGGSVRHVTVDLQSSMVRSETFQLVR